VGRDDELRILKDQLHATGREGKARMVSVIGEGGIGKTRLSQELVRYIDGISESVYYHSGRSPSYGDGVGLIDIARAFGAALGGDTEEAITLFATADDVWSDVVDPTRVAFARAAMAILLGPDEPMGVGWGEQAQDFFAEHGMKAYLDGIVQRVPAAAHGAELAG
jgi:hypothetical protein